MLPDEHDTIAAIASARGPAARGVIRVAGPDAVGVVCRAVDPPTARRLAVARSPVLAPDGRLPLELAGVARFVQADLYVWPDARSYARQPSVELHLPGSPPLLEAALRRVCEHGARLAQPGEFTLRAVLGGRIDLTQAEAVLGVIDARGDADLRTALAQLAGGMAAPLGRVREDLLLLLADLEAGLDFVDEEDVTFIEPAETAARLRQALAQVALAAQQAALRTSGDELPTVAIAGPPNAGKSTLLNALAQIAAPDRSAPPALVSARAGSTRDSLRRVLEHEGTRFELVDTAGEANNDPADSVESAAQRERQLAVEAAMVVLNCHAADSPEHSPPPALTSSEGRRVLRVLTKADLTERMVAHHARPVSATEGTGLNELLDEVVAAVQEVGGAGGMVSSTANRCRESLRQAEQDLERALELAPTGADDLVSLEVRAALDALGRVLGAVVTDDVLDRIFSRFCIGK